MIPHRQTYSNNTQRSVVSSLQSWSFSEQLVFAYAVLILTSMAVFYICTISGILPTDPDAMSLESVLTPPFSEGNLLGTDYLGRDILTRLMMGTEAYFLPGLLAVAIAIASGSFLGVITIYATRSGKRIINMTNNTLQSMPRLVVLFLFIAIFEPDIYIIMLIIGISHMPTVAKIVNNRILALQEKSFIESSIASGLSPFTIMFRHILWFNCRNLLIAQASLIMSEAILMETSLSYLGFGVQEPQASWGNMIQSGATYLLQGDIWPSTIPAIAVMLVLTALFLLSNLIIKKVDNY